MSFTHTSRPTLNSMELQSLTGNINISPLSSTNPIKLSSKNARRKPDEFEPFTMKELVMMGWSVAFVLALTVASVVMYLMPIGEEVSERESQRGGLQS
jgi:hypothetical protein